MNKKVIIFSMVALLFMWASLAAAAPDMKEGLWEITVNSKMEMPGMSMA